MSEKPVSGRFAHRNTITQLSDERKARIRSLRSSQEMGAGMGGRAGRI
jgi:hypothetical protein